MTLAIIGTGLAGYTLAREFRKLDTTTPLLLITRDDGAYYSKPQLSTALAQKKMPEDLALSDAQTMSRELNATILTETAVTKIDSQKKIIFTQKETISYDRCVLAIGASVIPLAVDKSECLFSVNDLTDYRKFRKNLSGKKHLTIIGAGLIGCEFANDAILAGLQVDVVALGETPLDTFVPSPIGQALANQLTEKGVRWHFKKTVASIVKESDSNFLLTLSSGETIQTEIILSAIGIRPSLSLAVSAGVQVNRGICVDAYLRSSVDTLFALGDCAEIQGEVRPYVAPIITAAKALASTLSGIPKAVSFPLMPVVVKTSIYPVTFLLPPSVITPDWHIQETAEGIRAVCLNANKEIVGFVLTGLCIKDRAAMLQGMRRE